MKKKIGLYLGAVPHAGGVYQYNLSVLQALRSLDSHYEIYAVYKDPGWEKILQSLNIPNAVRITENLLKKIFGKILLSLHLPIKWLRWIYPFFEQTVKTITDLKCDLWIFPSQDNWSYLSPVNSIVSIHDLMHRYENHFPEVGSPKEYSKREFNYKNICKYSVCILTDSECGKNQVYESYHANKEKIHILPYTISFDSLVFSCDHFKQKYNLPQKFLFYPAQFWKHKNHIRLINAIHSLIPQLKDLHIVFVGSPYNGYKEILSEVKKLNLEKYITVHSYVPQEDIPCFYRSARALVMPTFFGPTNIPPLEAIALGCPVAVSDIYGMRDQLQDSAVFFNPLSVPEIANSIKMLWGNDALCNDLKNRGLKRFESLNQHAFNSELKSILEQTLARI